MAGTEPGETRSPHTEAGGRRLAEPPSARYARADGVGRRTTDAAAGVAPKSGLPGPFARAAVVALVGAAALAGVAAFVGSALGLLFVAAISGGAVGLVMARATVPPGDARPVSRRSVAWLAVGAILAGVALADVATWLYALREGGTLGLFDYLLTTFGALIPGVAFVAALTAAWGAYTGPVQG